MAPEEAERLKRAMGFTTRHVVVRDDTTTADLCLHSAQNSSPASTCNRRISTG